MSYYRRSALRCGLLKLSATLALSVIHASAQEAPALPGAQPTAGLQTPKAGLWEHSLGEGFRPDTQSLSVLAGGAAGVAVFGGRQRHDLALLSLSYGHMLGGVWGEHHWWRGNLEMRGEVLSGAQFSPDTGWLVGLIPHLRYNFATGTRWMPFLDVGAGVSATDIGHPDLSSTFEFNLQGTCGIQYFLRENLAVTLEGRLLHISDAGLSLPNNGLNSVLGMVGVTWFF